jgi:GNAT superfamily N-acetyltransferase
MTTTGWHLRPLRPDDHARAAALIRTAFATLGVAVDPPPSALRETASGLAAMDGGAVAAAADGTLAGVLLWAERDGGLYVGRLAVAPSWRRRGIAQALLAAAEAEARARLLPRVHLGTRLRLAGNRRLFAACGFVETGQRGHPGYDHPTIVDMEKRLG